MATLTVRAACVFLPLALSLSVAQAQQSWDPGHTPLTPSGGTGTWDTTSTLWSNGAVDTAYIDGGAAIFGGTAGTVTLASSGANNSATEVDANSITINTAGYLFNGNYVRMTGTNPTITANADATFNAAVFTNVGGFVATGFIKAGSGTLTLAGTGIAGTTSQGTYGDTRFGGLIQVTGGTLALGNGATGSKGGYFDNSAFALSNGANVSFNYDTLTSDPNTISAISGAGNIGVLGMKNGYYSATTAAPFTNTGTTTVNLAAGGAQAFYSTFFLQNANVISATSVLNVLSGNVELRGAQTVMGLTNTGTAITGTTNTGGYITDNGGGSVLTLTPANGQTSTYGGIIGAGKANGNEGTNATKLTINGTGTGTQVLTGVNTYTGATTVMAGKLVVTGSIAGSAVTVTGGTFQGSNATGILAASLTATGGTIAPGGVTGPGRLESGSNVSISTASLSILLNGAVIGTGYSTLVADGSLTLGTAANLQLSLGFTPAVGKVFDLAQVGVNETGVFTSLNGVTTTLNQNSQFTTGGVTFKIGYTGSFDGTTVNFSGGASDVVLQVVAVPEPSTISLALVAAAVAVVTVFRRRGVFHI